MHRRPERMHWGRSSSATHVAKQGILPGGSTCGVSEHISTSNTKESKQIYLNKKKDRIEKVKKWIETNELKNQFHPSKTSEIKSGFQSVRLWVCRMHLSYPIAWVLLRDHGSYSRRVHVKQTYADHSRLFHHIVCNIWRQLTSCEHKQLQSISQHIKAIMGYKECYM